MSAPLTVAVAQPACLHRDVAANATAHAAAVTEARARLVVFPELSLTGYDLTAPAVSPDDARLGPIVSACRATGATALAGAPVRDADGREHIATLAVTGEGARVVYRKMWLHGEEFDRFGPGEKPEVLVVDGVRLGLAICYDAAVPDHAADTAALGIDAYVASTLYGAGPESAARRDGHMSERAATHGVWVVLSTSAGASGTYPGTSGGSGIWAPGGAVVVQAGPEPRAIVSASLGGP
ncbi:MULTISPECIES: carbon-nitrogen hydrolase family protein [unclassified Streptomyces]|uniref:carbon-nitrogen hydrolase family protein n=1 Tax=unclassified Streptomyces TaxID=2593676 RepID=UPI0008869EB9|nr:MULTISPECIES: carbon-nitrogen hydrolase family protein [unclassified Streptomyces]MDX2731728.1 carbon-nitrogen hydrolase family protein [Streptomyces sp. PA03-2a]SCZ01427.1 Predicted amidohydrolase [Streptomyces sp. 136MFCol5.1]